MLTAEANKAVEKVFTSSSSSGKTQSRKRKYTATFTAEDCASIGKYTSEMETMVFHKNVIIKTQ